MKKFTLLTLFLVIFVTMSLSARNTLSKKNEDEEKITENPINFFKWSDPPKVVQKKRVLIPLARHIKGLPKCISKFIIQKKLTWTVTFGLKTPDTYFKSTLKCVSPGCFRCLLRKAQQGTIQIASDQMINSLLGPLSFTKGFYKFPQVIKEAMVKVVKRLNEINNIVKGKRESVQIDVDSEGDFKIWMNDLNPDILVRLEKTLKMKRFMFDYGSEVTKVGKNLRRVTPELLKDSKIKELIVDMYESKKYQSPTEFNLNSWCSKCNVGLLFEENTMTPYFIHDQRALGIDDVYFKPYPVLGDKLGGNLQIGKSVRHILKNSRVSFINGENVGFVFEQKNPSAMINLKELLNFLFSSVNTKVKDLPPFLKDVKIMLKNYLSKHINEARRKCRKSLLSFNVLFNIDDLFKSKVEGYVSCQHPRVSLNHVFVAFNNFQTRKCSLYPGFSGGFGFSTDFLQLVGQIKTYISYVKCESRKCFEDCFPLTRLPRLRMNLPKFDIPQIEDRLKKYGKELDQKVKDLQTTISAFRLVRYLDE